MTALYANPHGPTCPWYGPAEWLGAPNIKWCEASLCNWVSEPANTWSNLAYLLVALIVFLQCRRSAYVELRWLGPALLLMGLFSSAYHASNNYLSQLFDFLGMYLVLFWLLAINLRRNGWISRASQTPAFASMTVAGLLLVHLMYLTQLRFQLIIAVVSLAILLTEFTARRHDAAERLPLRHYSTGLVFLVLAQSASLADLTRLICDPENHFVQGHALWHGLSALALYFTVQHYRQLRYS